MARNTNAQDKLERAFIASFEEYESSITKQSKTVLQAISGTRPINFNAGTLDRLEGRIYATYSQSLRSELETAVHASATNLSDALIAAIGPVAVAELVGIQSAMSAAEMARTGILTGLVFALLFGIGIAEFVDELVESIMNRTSRNTPEGPSYSTKQRIRQFARQLALEATKVIRQGIRGDSTDGDIARAIGKVYLEADWRVKRLVETETLTAYRTSIAELAGKSSLFENVKIIDFGIGHEHTHPRHRCYKYARADEHGLGPGIYPPTVRKIRNPHPQCRSILVPVLSGGE